MKNNLNEKSSEGRINPFTALERQLLIAAEHGNADEVAALVNERRGYLCRL